MVGLSRRRQRNLRQALAEAKERDGWLRAMVDRALPAARARAEGQTAEAGMLAGAGWWLWLILTALCGVAAGLVGLKAFRLW